MILLRFDYTSVSSISILFGFVALFAGAAEIGVLFMAAGWWKLLHALLAFVFFVAGIVAFIHPGNTFLALAAVFSFFLIFAGTFDIVIAISTRHEIEVWWLQLIGGIIELALGILGGRLLRAQRDAAGRLGGGVRDHPRGEGHRARLPRARDPARALSQGAAGSCAGLRRLFTSRSRT